MQAGIAVAEPAFAFTAADFDQLAGLLHRESGIVLERSKMPLVYSRLLRRLRALKLGSFSAYCGLVAADSGLAERRRMIEALTTNVTRFFRENHHFEHLRTMVLPGLIAEARAGGRVRLWSAGCSTGEEPYSIALTILAALPDAARFDIRVLATDIDTDVLRQGSEGLYPQGSVAAIDPAARARWLVQEDDPGWWRMGPAVRGLVTFRAANLVGEWPMRGPFQVVFCRNTVIYFDAATCAAIWQKMFSRLAPGGHLYIGHSERMQIPAAQFCPVGLSTYRREAGDETLGRRTDAESR